MKKSHSLKFSKTIVLYTTISIGLSQNLYGQVVSYKDAGLPVETRANDLLSRMTLAEKIAQMSMFSLKKLETDKNGLVTGESLEQLFKGESIGCLESPRIRVEDIAKLSEAADSYLRTKTRLGIPAIQIAECLHGYMAFGATIFPQAIAQGSTWNPDLIQKMGETIAMEASLSGVDQALSPLFDLARDPRYGRVEECFGEDPFHVAEMGKAFVIGMQGDPGITKNNIPDNHLMCTAKHFAGSTPTAGINLGPIEVGPRNLRDLYLYPFEKAIKEANIYSVMPSYNEIDGIPLHANQYLLRDILKEEYNFKGYVFSDYGALRMLESFHKVSADKAETVLLALQAGVDLEAPQGYAYPELGELVEEGKVDIGLIDEAVKHILTVKFRAGLFDKPYITPNNISELVHSEEAVSLARQITEESIVLLKNENALLPLDVSRLRSVAVIGPNADRVQYGDYSYTKSKLSGVTILEGIKNYANNRLKINYAEGCNIAGIDTTGFKEAVKIAGQSDLVVLVIGGTSKILSGIGWGENTMEDDPTCGEGYDRADLIPPGVQPQLIRAVYKTGKPVILIMVHGRAYDIRWEKEHIPAILEAWYPGEQGGNAVAGILFGDVNPSGKLPVSFPQSVGHIPAFYNYKPSGRGYYHKPGTTTKPGRDYVFHSTDPLFPFGFGLSYAQFEYSDLKIEQKLLNGTDTVRLSLKVRNAGKVAGKEVIQLYIHDKISSVTTPVKVLKGFTKIEIKPGDKKTVSFELPCKELGLWNKDMNYVVEPGEFEIMVGSSSEDIYLRDSVIVKNTKKYL
ncbi:MAG: hypothetical protein A2W90_16855 [Bacteroidetes bacterium GWF2_42_66]|nr:MAG: hypothetical protein A2W92_03760 [Bacteroidetes bacterium GWA2_42_15]OFX96359.1 MAG: hypothetical protein A2W89_05785 [Bacteroidetes bacterium GWE2_42_39]OFY46398.1 MAG: hypothetical protein A2W90_16855 [Bacteroidetes bacterium GWF2_42_66]HAZ03738.1 glycosyl hydrolase [Marinilabiliales bacterium]HBL78216.1 glycosyl hydrolase [Prolixibacteraceae bacterium]